MNSNTCLQFPPSDENGNEATNGVENAMITNSQPSMDDRLSILLKVTENAAITTSNLINQTSDIMNQLSIVASNSSQNTDRIAKIEADREAEKQQAPVTEEHAGDIHESVNKRVYGILGLRKKKMTEEQKRFRNVYAPAYFRALYDEIKATFKVSKYSHVKETEYEDVMQLVRGWLPENEEELKRDAEENWRARHPGQKVSDYIGKPVPGE